MSSLTVGKMLHILVSCSIKWDGAVCLPSCDACECALGLAAPSHPLPSHPSICSCSAGTSRLSPHPNFLSAVAEGRRDQCEVPRDPKYPDCAGKVEVSWDPQSGRGSWAGVEAAGKGRKQQSQGLNWEGLRGMLWGRKLL